MLFEEVLLGAVLNVHSGYRDAFGNPLPNHRHVTVPWKPIVPPLHPEFSNYATWERILAAQGDFQIVFATWGTMPLTAELTEDEIVP